MSEIHLSAQRVLLNLHFPGILPRSDHTKLAGKVHSTIVDILALLSSCIDSLSTVKPPILCISFPSSTFSEVDLACLPDILTWMTTHHLPIILDKTKLLYLPAKTSPSHAFPSWLTVIQSSPSYNPRRRPRWPSVLSKTLQHYSTLLFTLKSALCPGSSCHVTPKPHVLYILWQKKKKKV